MSKEFLSQHTVALVTLGCAKNEVDSRGMLSALEQQGFCVSENLEEADFVLLNTCAFIAEAVEESLDTLFELSLLSSVQEGRAQLVVLGCLPSRYGTSLFEELPEVAAFVSVAKEDELGGILRDLARPKAASSSSVDGLDLNKTVQHPCLPEPWAYVKISDGCSRRCSYCTIPSIRGSYHDYSYQQIDTEVKTLVGQGAREIVLIGQDTGLWRGIHSRMHEEKETPASLAELLDVLACGYPHTWFRVMYLQPEGVSSALLEVMASHDNIAPYLDIPLQHVSTALLKAMNRRGSAKEYLALIEHVREALPGVSLRTTMMTGFPGESPEDFEELCAFIERACFDYVGVFTYSREEGTAAAEMPQQIDRELALKRAQDLRDLADKVSFECAQKHHGTTLEVLVCGRDGKENYGRTQGQAPEVDGVSYFLASSEPDGADVFNGAEAKKTLNQETLQPGDRVFAEVVSSVLYDLFVKIG